MNIRFKKTHLFYADYLVLLENKKIGILKVSKNGWSQQQAKRGTPSQSWRFIAETNAGLKIQDSIGSGEYFNYLKDIKKAILNAKISLTNTTLN